MRKAVTKLVLDIIKDYPTLDERIQEKVEAIRHPWQFRDENVGGGQAKNKISNWTEHVVIKLNDDQELHDLKLEKVVIANCLEDAGNETETIIRESCIKGRSIQELVAKQEIYCGVSRAYHLRNNFVKEVAQRLGIANL